MKFNASTSTDFEIEKPIIKKRLSLKSLFTPHLRFKILFEKTLMLHDKSNNNSETQNTFANKSIFVLKCRNLKFIDNHDKKYNSTKKMISNKFNLKKININRNLRNPQLSINDTLNNNTKIKYRKLTLRHMNDITKNFSQHSYFSRTIDRKNIPIYPIYSNEKVNNAYLDIKKRWEYKTHDQTLNKVKCKFTNDFNKNNSIFTTNKKNKKYKLKAKKV